MLVTNKIKITNLIFYSFSILFLFSCKKKNKEFSTERKYEITYEMNIKRNNEFILVLHKQISQKILETNNDSILIQEYHQLTSEYIDYLTSIENILRENGNEIFFDELKESDTGENFIEKSVQYNKQIKRLINEKNFINRFDMILNTDDQIENNLAMRYLDYYFRGYPKLQSISFISDRKRRVLELELEFVNMSN